VCVADAHGPRAAVKCCGAPSAGRLIGTNRKKKGEQVTDCRRSFQSIRHLGIPLDDDRITHDVEFCTVCEKRTGVAEPAYYRHFAIGDKTKASWRPLNRIGAAMLSDNDTVGAIKNCLIGLLYEDGSIRQDIMQVLTEIYADQVGLCNWPKYVLFWRDHVPMNLRSGLAAYKGPHDNKVQV